MRKGLLEGKREGLLKAVSLGLKLKFGPDSLHLLPAIQAITEIDKLEALCDALEEVTNLDELRQWCA
jgi:hypothetical protein